MLSKLIRLWIMGLFLLVIGSSGIYHDRFASLGFWLIMTGFAMFMVSGAIVISGKKRKGGERK